MTAEVERGYAHRVASNLGWRPFAALLLIAALVSTQVLFQPHLFEMWDLRDIAHAWAAYFGEVAAIGVAMMLAVVAAEQWRVARVGARLTLLAAALVLPVLVLVWLFAWRHSGRWWPSAPWSVAGETLKFSMLGAFACAARALQRHVERVNAQALAFDAARRELERQAAEAQLQLLQAQIEPHFLFNTLANVRRLYRKNPSVGAETIDNLMAYLRAALPQVRRTESTLGDEFELTRAYLQLFQVRMGARLRFSLDLPPALRALPFPPMVLLTLAENAIKHGLSPADLGGTVRMTARRHDACLEVCVVDDGVGFSATAGGQGVGLVNIRRQLQARHGDRARLTLEQREEGGVCARISLPSREPVHQAPNPAPGTGARARTP